MKCGQTVRWIFLLGFVSTLAACGGGGGAANSSTSNESPQTKSIGFNNSGSDVLAVFLTEQAGEPAVVIMRDPVTGAVADVEFVFEDGSRASAKPDSAGRLGELTVDAHRFAFSNYTATNVTMTYYAPAGAVSVILVDSATQLPAPKALVAKALQAAADPTFDQVVDQSLQWFRDIRNYHIVAKILTVAEVVANKVEKALAKAEGLATKAVDKIVNNKLTCLTVTTSKCAEATAKETPQLVSELESIDPNAKTTAGFLVTDSSIEPTNSEWDAAVLAGEVVIGPNGSCVDGILASETPGCPQYEPPVEPIAPVAQDTILQTDINQSVSNSLSASGADYFEMVRSPANGTFTKIDIVSGNFTYQPNDGYIGGDSFSFVAINGSARSNEGVVRIGIGANQVPNSSIDHITITPAAPSVAVGQTVQLTATAYNASNNEIAIPASEFSWSSANTAIATVNSSGLVTGITLGTATITVTHAATGKTASGMITVGDAAPSSTPSSTLQCREYWNPILEGTWKIEDCGVVDSNGVCYGSKENWTINLTWNSTLERFDKLETYTMSGTEYSYTGSALVSYSGFRDWGSSTIEYFCTINGTKKLVDYTGGVITSPGGNWTR